MRAQKVVLCIGSGAIELSFRCALLKEHGWNVISSGSGRDGIFRFGEEAVDAVVLDMNDDGSEAALIAGELKRQRPDVPIVLIVTDQKILARGATDQADAVVLKANEAGRLAKVVSKLLKA
ncbi:MAG TPA: hypothetical protein VMD99_16935 [Terriglobales bacterium]|nr:hypothetical protein [Terriglobales bacterium]